MSQTMWPPVMVLDAIGSTNDVALDAARAGAQHGACWAAEHQTGGRGRREASGQRRVWYSPAGVNVAASILLRIKLPPAEAASVTLAAAVGALRAIEAACGVRAGVKWPNDLYLQDRKLAGILTEAVTEGGRIVAVVVGIGINVNLEEAQIPEELRGQMTSLRIASGERHDRQALLMALRREVVTCVDAVAARGLGEVVEALREADVLRGHEVRFVGESGEPVRGVACGITAQGELVVEVEGRERRVSAGEVNRVRRDG